MCTSINSLSIEVEFTIQRLISQFHSKWRKNVTMTTKYFWLVSVVLHFCISTSNHNCVSQTQFLNQVCAQFLRITFVLTSVWMHAYMCVSLLLRLLLISGMMWCDVDLVCLVKQILQLLYGSYSWYRQEFIIKESKNSHNTLYKHTA